MTNMTSLIYGFLMVLMIGIANLVATGQIMTQSMSIIVVALVAPICAAIADVSKKEDFAEADGEECFA